MNRFLKAGLTVLGTGALHGALAFFPLAVQTETVPPPLKAHLVAPSRPETLPLPRAAQKPSTTQAQTTPVAVSRPNPSPVLEIPAAVAVPDGTAESLSSPPFASASAGPAPVLQTDPAAYRALVRQGVAEHKDYPYAARTRNQQGTVVVAFEITASGALAKAPRVVRSSLVHRLDEAALSAVAAAAPFPPPPTDGDWTFVVPIEFVLD